MAAVSSQNFKTRSFLEQGRRLRTELLNVMDDLQRKGKEFELAPPDENFSFAQKRLHDNTFNILVVGEAKRGKSSFVNGLIGESLLPTDIDVSTARIFRIQKAPVRSCRLRFQDDSTREISYDDLYRYGSQKAADEGTRVEKEFAGKALRWIEVDTPARFLPEGMAIIDTPGMGTAHYASHDETTDSVVPLADGVIFVLESKQPIIQSEVDFIKRIRAVTPHLFFIQTKIDAYDVDVWQSVLSRSEQVLAQAFEIGNASTGQTRKARTVAKIWPISNKNLQAAAGSKRPEVILMDSCYPELSEALQQFIYRVAGLSRSAAALAEVNHYHNKWASTLNDRLVALVNRNSGKLNEMDATIQQRVKEIKEGLGEESKMRALMQKDVSAIMAAIRKRMSQILTLTDKTWDGLKKSIDHATDADLLKKIERRIPEKVVATANQAWRKLVMGAEIQLFLKLQLLRNELDIPITDSGQLSKRGKSEASKDYFANLKRAMFDSSPGASAGSIGGGLVGGLGGAALASAGFITVTAAGPILIAAGSVACAAGALWTFIRVWKKTNEGQIKATQESLMRYLNSCINEVRRQFMDADVDKGRPEGLADAYLNSSQAYYLKEIDKMVRRRKEELEAELKIIQDRNPLDEKQHHEAKIVARRRVIGWSVVGEKIQEIDYSLSRLATQFGSKRPGRTATVI